MSVEEEARLAAAAAEGIIARAARDTLPEAERLAVADGASAIRSGVGWSGVRYVGVSSPAEEAAYAAIRANAGDVTAIAQNTGIQHRVLDQVKTHLFLSEHDVVIGPNQVAHGLFVPDGSVAELWTKAEQGTLSAAEQNQFRWLISHEYVESRLMEAGMPYRSPDPRAWSNGLALFDPAHVGAHEVAPLASNGSLRLWQSIGLTPPATPVAPDLSNIDIVVDAARQGLQNLGFLP